MARLRIALLGDSMLGRRVGDRIRSDGPGSVLAAEVVAVAHEADLVVANLECALSDRGAPWPAPGKPFFFRGPPSAVGVLTALGVDCVTLANNHALDYGAEALLDTLDVLDRAGIAHVGAGADVDAARAPVVLRHAGVTVGVVGATDHPADFAAAPQSAGVAYADLRRSTPRWLLDAVAALATDVRLVTPHWGPNMVASPVAHVRRAAGDLRAAGATLVAGHSAHVFHGVGDGVVYDVGDFIDDYATDPVLRNDLGVLVIAELAVEQARAWLVRVEAVPLCLEYCFTRLADDAEARWIAQRLRRACADLGTNVVEHGGRLVVELAPVTP
jgi:poly-gamma-glutamate synthesis protein (capsule biosynthesis protein)